VTTGYSEALQQKHTLSTAQFKLDAAADDYHRRITADFGTQNLKQCDKMREDDVLSK